LAAKVRRYTKNRTTVTAKRHLPDFCENLEGAFRHIRFSIKGSFTAKR
jgi:hypothetical protein